jgi:hypothetical protein
MKAVTCWRYLPVNPMLTGITGRAVARDYRMDRDDWTVGFNTPL